MNNTNDFDELARRKLAERDFPFEEAHWQQAQAAIRTAREGRRPGGWFIMGCAALIIGTAGGMWPSSMVSTSEASTIANAGTSAQQKESEQIPTTPSSSSAPSPEIPEPQQVANGIAATSATLNTPDHAAATQPQVQKKTHSAKASVAHATQEKVDDGHAASRNALAQALHVQHEDPVQTDQPQRSAVPQGQVNNAAPTGTNDFKAEDGSSVPQKAPSNTSLTSGQDIPVRSDTSSTPEAIVAAAAPSEPPSSTAPSEPDATLQANTAPAPTVARRDTLNDHDSTTVASLPNDSAIAVPGAATPLVPPASPWEFTALGGMLSSSTRYSGDNGPERNAATSSRMAPTMGLEVMHMGKHFGIGAGVHYTTYAEQLSSEGSSLTSSQAHHYYVLVPTDTTIFFITDTVQNGGQTSYTGTPVHTTIYTLDPRVDTLITTTELRKARTVLNQVSYLEIPVLFDAHYVLGRWSFGVIGGPTIGLLTGRRGALPSNADEGYTDLNDERFRSLMFGYTARAYARFRIGDRWSLGAEPTLRGQLLSTLDNGTEQRRTQAFGAQLSFTYRLR